MIMPNDVWDEFKSGSEGGYAGGLDDLSTGGDSDVYEGLDWQESLGEEDDLAQQWLNKNAEVAEAASAKAAGDPLMGMHTDEAVLQARLLSSGLPVTHENKIGIIPESQRPSAVTTYDLSGSGLTESERNIENLTRGSIRKGITTTTEVSPIPSQQLSQFNSILNASKVDNDYSSDAMPAIGGHASNLTKEDYSIGGKSVDQVLFNLAGQYLQEDAPRYVQSSLAKRLGYQIPKTSKGMQMSFGEGSHLSHFDALPLPSALPSMYFEHLKPTLNVSGGIYNPAYKEARDYRFAPPSKRESMDYFNKPSPIATLTGSPYVGMHKSQQKLSELDPMQKAALESQKDIEADFKGFLALGGLAKNVSGKRYSSDNSQGTATNFIQPTAGQEYYGSSNLNELAAHGLMDEAGLRGDASGEGQMSSLGNYADAIMEDEGGNAIDFNRPFTSSDIAKVLGEEAEESRAEPTVKAKLKPTPILSSPDISVADVKAAMAPKESGSRQEERNIAQANVEAALRAKGLNISSAEQGSAEWRAARGSTLTSTGIATAMAEPVYGGTWVGSLGEAINEKNNPEVASQLSNPIFDAGTRGEILGKKWFEDKFDKTIVDLGLITDPNKPNQGTSLDGVVTSRGGEVGDRLELTEFKWGTTAFPPRDGDKKHQQQLQHQMYMTGAESVNLITGYDPNSGSFKAGREDEYVFSNKPVFKDPEWAANNADFIQARANEKAAAIESGSTAGVKEAYLAALAERYPDESDKGLTKAEKAEKKRQSDEERKEDKAEQKEAQAKWSRIDSSLKFMSGGTSGFTTQNATSFIGSLGPAGRVVSAVAGVATAAYDATRASNNIVGEAADVGADSTQGYEGSKVALQSLSFSDKQAESMASSTYQAQALASVGNFDPLVEKVVAYRGLISVEEMQNLSVEERTILTRKRAEERGISGQQLAGMAIMAKDLGMARDFQNEQQSKQIAKDAEGRAAKGLVQESKLRDLVGTANYTAVELNAANKAKELVLAAGGSEVAVAPTSNAQDTMQEFKEDSWLESALDVMTFAPRKGLETIGKVFGQDLSSQFSSSGRDKDGAGGLVANFNRVYNPSDNLVKANKRYEDAAYAKSLNDFKFWASDEENAAIAKEYSEAGMNRDAASKLEMENNTSNKPAKIDINVNSVIENNQTVTEVDASLNDEPVVKTKEYGKEE